MRGELGERTEPRERRRQTEVLLSTVSSLAIGQIQGCCPLHVNDSVGWLMPQMSVDLVVAYKWYRHQYRTGVIQRRVRQCALVWW